MQDSVYPLVLGLLGVPKTVCLAVYEACSFEVLDKALVFLENGEVFLSLLPHSLVLRGEGLDVCGEFVEL